MARGDDALAGREERDIPSHRFPPTTIDRTINFKGKYISIVNQETNDQIAFEDNEIPTTKYKPYKVPAGYTCYIRVASVWFEA